MRQIEKPILRKLAEKLMGYDWKKIKIRLFYDEDKNNYGEYHEIKFSVNLFSYKKGENLARYHIENYYKNMNTLVLSIYATDEDGGKFFTDINDVFQYILQDLKKRCEKEINFYDELAEVLESKSS